MDATLSVKGLRVSFKTDNGTVKAIRGVDLTVRRGETLAVVGESGSGKSVTSKAVMGILPRNAVVESGEIIFDGRDLLKMSEKELCNVRGRGIAMIFQDPMSSLDPIVKVGRQITETMRSNKGERLTAKQAKQRALKLMAEVGISEPERRFE